MIRMEYTNLIIHPSKLQDSNYIQTTISNTYTIDSTYIKRVLYIVPKYSNNYIDKNGYIVIKVQCVVEYVYYFLGEIINIDNYIKTTFGALISLYNHIKILIPEQNISSSIIEIIDINIKHQYLCIGTCI